jgi:hypothetical protein
MDKLYDDIIAGHLEKVPGVRSMELLRWLIGEDKSSGVVLLEALVNGKRTGGYKTIARDEGGFIALGRQKGKSNIANTMKFLRTKWMGKGDLEDRDDTWAHKIAKAETLKNVSNRREFEEVCLEIWPFRVKADRVLRRIRIWDVYQLYNDHELFMSRMKFTLGHGYLRAMIALLAFLGNDSKWYELLSWVFRKDMETYTAIMKSLSDHVKAFETDDDWHKYAELHNLTGYRNLPWPGYDPEDDTRALAEGGDRDHPTWKFSFKWWLNRAMDGTWKSTQSETFDQFVKSGRWLTGGSSSQGRLYVEWKGKKYKIKCSKKTSIFVLDADELVAMSQAKILQESFAFVKNESGKLRIAVASDLETYLKMFYVVDQSGRGYKQWEAVTRNDDARRKLTRMMGVVDRCRLGDYGMPWDYAGFERQVKTSELQTVWDALGRAALRNNGTREMQHIIANVRQGLANSIIITPNRTTKLKVEGGLPSGLYLTSLMGDVFNKAAVMCVLSDMRYLGIDDLSIDDVMIQGDDTSVMAHAASNLQIFDWLLTRHGFVGGTGKFGIIKSRNEFLRVAYDNLGALGYPARSLIGVAMRKPWSEQPLDEADVIRSCLESVNTTYRRGLNVGKWSDRLLRFWCRTRKISYLAARAPQMCGGLGLGKPVANVRVKRETEAKIQPTVTNAKYDWKVEVESIRIGEWFDIKDKQGVFKMAEDDLRNMVTKGDTGDIGKANREAQMARWRNAKVVRLKDISMSWQVNRVTPIREWLVQKRKQKQFGVDHRRENLIAEWKRWREYGIINDDQLEFAKKTKMRSRFTGGKNLTAKDRKLWRAGDLSIYNGKWNSMLAGYVETRVVEEVNVGMVPKDRLRDVWIILNLRVLEGLERDSDFIAVAGW